ncbi:Amylo-alpha-1,6-glucosidase [Besnoitia besnoiti]|uniref:Amylo-alpha-1,6-glucosidase n=1 Tax=Besnoitia besnoiti TaxID=94643 RepID=A0A2A9MI59_BESBE|nr:Amylo-alpha-1,6-glucosidase [Besnoitia besnoiti]PFH35082.1 Amylo-alpha-1,6-glucosidase [Besnoitia besnoiti]
MRLPPVNAKRLPQPGEPSLAHMISCAEVFSAHFDREGMLDAPDRAAGNFRVSKGASIDLLVLNGSQPHPVAGCVVETPLGETEQLRQTADDLGNLVFMFKAKLAGPYRIQLQYGAGQPSASPAHSRTTSASTPPTPEGGQGAGAGQASNAEWPAASASLSPVSVIIVEPALSINGVPLKQESISLQTVLSRCLGPFARWRRMFTNTGELGYNMIHFTPLQALGESGSCYSIADQLHISEFFLDDTSEPSLSPRRGASGAVPGCLAALRRANSSEIVGLEELKAIIHLMETELGLLSTIDLVLNHTASNSPWLRDHPDSGYSPDNSPWLTGAYELDWKLQEFSLRVVRGEFAEKYGATKHIDNEHQLQNVMRAFNEELLKPFRMEEWFYLHVDDTVAAWKAAHASAAGAHAQPSRLDDGQMQDRIFNEAIKSVGVKRGPTIVVSGAFLRDLLPLSEEGRLRGLLSAVCGRLVDKARESEDFVHKAVEGHARWERLECRRGPLGEKHWEALAPRYFTPLDESPEPAQRSVLANNGWVMGWDATKDFAAAGALVYLRRELVVWSDCVKLRYGKGPEDAPFLWNHMTEYCRMAAKAFHGVRLDNCHSTPIHVAQHMLRECRRIRPDFWVFAELFTGSQAMDLHFERCLGINALVREAMQTHNAGDLAYHLKKFGMKQGLGQLSPIFSLNRSGAPVEAITSAAACAGASRAASPAADATHETKREASEDRSDPASSSGFFSSLARGFSSTVSLPPAASLDAASPSSPSSPASTASPSPAPLSPATRRGVPLRPALCPALFYDCTHDNETPNQKFTAAAALPFSVLLAAAGCPVGSTRGYDELVPRTLSVVAENRVYEDYHGDVPLINPVALIAGSELKAVSNGTTVDAEEAVARPKILDELALTCKHGGNHVVMRGSWDNWERDVSGERDENGHVRIVLRKGAQYGLKGDAPEKLQFKFVVDGNWTVDSDLPCEKDGWNVNNVLMSDGASPDAHATWKQGDSPPGLLAVRPILNALHVKAGQEGFEQLDAECKTDDLVVAVRHHPVTHECIYFIARCAYHCQQGDYPLPEIRLSGKIKEVPLMATLALPGDAEQHFRPAVAKINGLPGAAKLFSDLSYFAPNTYFDGSSNTTSLHLQNFPRGSALIVRTAPAAAFADAAQIERERAAAPLFTPAAATCSALMSHYARLWPLLQETSLAALSELLFSCEQEERDRGRGLYEVSGYGSIVYAGLTGPVAILDEVRRVPFEAQTNQPVFRNLKEGYWLLRYAAGRIAPPCLEPIKAWLQEAVDIIEHRFPVYDWLRPYYADDILSHLYALCCRFVLDKMPLARGSVADAETGQLRIPGKLVMHASSPKGKKKQNPKHPAVAAADGADAAEGGIAVSPGDHLLALLSVSTLQFYSFVPSAPLVWRTLQPSISAGLPFFSAGFMRAWGRDTFIALKGILLTTSRYEEAKAEILGFARVMRHGLIPNLLDAGNNPRYNARDATWFFCQAIQDYCVHAPEGLQILKTPVEMKYEGNATQAPDLPINTLADVLHHILLSHAKGIDFREWNAGKQIDEHMRDEGFNIRIYMDPNTGLIFGGNRFNCGTWMDKMGSSDKAHNRGLPATPRDGAAVEIIGLLKSTLRFVTMLPEEFFPYKTVTTSAGQEMTYVRWNSLLEARFEKCFYVPQNAQEDSQFFVDSQFINRRGIYKDTFKASEVWRDYQLRPNVCVALAVAPELFDRAHAREYLAAVEKALWGPKQLGLKTLDPSDWNYRPDYDNSNDSDDFHVAHGYNYHQGPEWIWPLGYFLKAKMIFAEEFDAEPGAGGKTGPLSKSPSSHLKAECMQFLQNHRAHLDTDRWRSLPELTNSSGSFCKDSCPAQAWSIATLLAVVGDLVSGPVDLQKIGLKAGPSVADDDAE